MLGGTADFVEREKAGVTIERGVFDGFGHDGTGELLKFPDEELDCLTFGVIGVGSGFGEKHIADEVEGRLAHFRVACFGLSDGFFNEATITKGNPALLNIGAVDAEAGDEFLQRACEAVESEVAGPAVLFGNPVELMGEYIELAGHAVSNIQPLADVREFREVVVGSREAGVGCGEIFFTQRIDEDVVEGIEKFITDSSVDLPIGGKGFAVFENFLDDSVDGS